MPQKRTRRRHPDKEGVVLAEKTRKRKAEHIEISLSQNVQARQKTTGFEEADFVHRVLPEIDRSKIDLSTTVFGHKFSAPLIVGALTGGTPEAAKINSTVAEAVERLGLGMGVGSQRVAIEDKRLEDTFAVVRKKAPSAFVLANLGAIQFANGYGPREARKALEMIEADAIAIHLNALQEAVQPEGQTNFVGILSAIGDVARELEKPVIAKETGAGMSAEEARRLEEAGVKGIDVSGAGGTSWAAVEYYRARKPVESPQRRLGDVFWDWGIPTAASLVEVCRTVHIPVIASGGIRDGAAIAKSISLGASLTSLSQPILKAAVKGVKETCDALSLLIEELRNAMFLVGAGNVQALRASPVVIMGKTAEWLKARGFSVEEYARRGRK